MSNDRYDPRLDAVLSEFLLRADIRHTPIEAFRSGWRSALEENRLAEIAKVERQQDSVRHFVENGQSGLTVKDGRVVWVLSTQ